MTFQMSELLKQPGEKGRQIAELQSAVKAGRKNCPGASSRKNRSEFKYTAGIVAGNRNYRKLMPSAIA